MAGEFNIEIEYRHVPRLDSGSEESASYLDEYGYVIIKNALTSEEAQITVDHRLAICGAISGYNNETKNLQQL